MGKTVTIFGKQVPVAVLVGAAGLLGVILVMRARSRGSNVVSAGNAAAAAAAAQGASAAATYDPNLNGLVSNAGTPFAGTPDYGSQLAAIQSQLATLAGSSASAPAAVDPSQQTYAQRVDALVVKDWGTHGDPQFIQEQVAALAKKSPAEQALAYTYIDNFLQAQPQAVAYALAHPPAGAATTTQVAAHA